MRTPCLVMCCLWAIGCGSRSDMSTVGAGAGAGAAGGAGGATSGGSAGAGSGGTGATGGTGAGAAGGGGAGGAPAISVMDACVIAASCGRGGGWMDFTASSCLDGFARLGWRFDSPARLPDPELAQRLLDCAAKTEGNCAKFTSCFGGDWVDLSRCREGGSCLENTITASIEGPSFDCGSIGATCADLWSGAQRACCNAEPCSQSTDMECDGTVASYCGGWGEHVTFDCAPSGRTCLPGPGEDVTPCAGDAPCEPETPIACEGDVAVYCSGGGLAKYDCSTTGFRTACNGGAAYFEPACRPAGSACDPQWDLSTCDGPWIRVCADGEWVDVDCQTVGFAKCEEFLGAPRCIPMWE